MKIIIQKKDGTQLNIFAIMLRVFLWCAYQMLIVWSVFYWINHTESGLSDYKFYIKSLLYILLLEFHRPIVDWIKKHGA